MGTSTPLFFIGHGSPMNAIGDNRYTRQLNWIGRHLPIPKAILCISAHWLTRGTCITGMKAPRTIHDFSGFPQELFNIRYPAPGDPELAQTICQTIQSPNIKADDTWGLDHGTWSVLRHLYPQANIPTLQLSLDLSQPPEYHFQLGQSLRFLRAQGVLMIGSGNIVHNLSKISWHTDAKPYDWAIEFDEWAKQQIQNRNFKALINEFNQSSAGQLSIPTTEHYLPLLYILGASNETDTVRFEYEGIENASISMRSASYGM